MNIKVINIDATPLKKVSHSTLVWNWFLAWSSVNEHTAMKKRPQRMIDSIGATTQLAHMMPSLGQLMLSDPTVARPDPIKAPTTVCVPEIGMPKTEDDMMKRNEEMEEPSIIFSTKMLSMLSTPSIQLATS